MRNLNEEFPILIAQGGPLSGKHWTLRTEMLIGREDTCDITIPERQVSRHHARIKPSTNGYLLEDLSSKNGTHCNGVQIINPTLLNDGDIIQIALIQLFLFTSSDATLPLGSDQYLPAAQLNYLLKIDKKSRRVWIAEQEVNPPLSVSQYKLLELLYDNQNNVVSRIDLIEHIWGESQAVLVSEQALDALIRRLRERLTSIDPTHEFITTIRGHGLRLDNPSI